MSARLNLNEIRYSTWKGKTFTQIVSAIQKNAATIPMGSVSTARISNQNLFKSRPLKIYRREIAANSTPHYNPRQSIRIAQFEQPGGTVLSKSTYNNCTGLATTEDAQEMNVTTNLYQMSAGKCNNAITCLSQQNNALRRVRSAGMIKRNYNPATNNDTYCTSTQQYLTARNRTFQQNQYNYIRQGNPTAEPGSNAAIQNIYSANGLNHCRRTQVSAAIGNNTFSYRWIDYNGTTVTTQYTVTIPDGYYDLDGFNSQFRAAMTANNHYYITNSNQSKVFLLNIAFSNTSQSVELQCVSNAQYYNNSVAYRTPAGVTWNTAGNSNVPVFIIGANISKVIGFAAGNYPAAPQTTNQYLKANTVSSLQPLYVQVYYKPNNPQFAQQGAVDSSTRTARKDYDTITTVGASYSGPYGRAMANALAYGGAPTGYNLKQRIGYPLMCSPVVSNNGTINKCRPRRQIQFR
jgi:hypothetical protein